jgi:hypothetical protein
MRGAGFEDLRALFADTRLHIALGVITQVEVATDRSVARVMVQVLPEMREIVARMTWEYAAPNAGIMGLPEQNDVVLLGMAEGDEEQAYVLRRLTTREDQIPIQAIGGDLCVVAKSGKKLWLSSADKIYLSKSETAPTENMVLGQVFKTLMENLLDALASHTHISSTPGFPTAPPANAATFTGLKASPVSDEAVLSDVAFTEK